MVPSSRRVRRYFAYSVALSSLIHEDGSVNFVLDLLGNAPIWLLPDLLFSGKSSDRRLFEQNRVRCGLRAVEGRVLNIGTEWSSGVCEVTSGQLRFIPSIGIVGDRKIEVTGLRAQARPLATRDQWPWGDSANIIVSTASGDLHWVIPLHMADDVLARLMSGTQAATG